MSEPRNIHPPGRQEVEALEAIRESGPISVGDMARNFGEPRGIARTTVLTMMERLRKKGHLRRSKVNGVFLYSAEPQADENLKGLVADFVRRALGGSLSPFVSYLVESGDLTPAEIDQLRELVQPNQEAGS